MGLGLAGAISGMGHGLERGLQQMQGGLIQYGLGDADRKFQSEKLQLQMQHAERLQDKSLSATASEGEKTRTHSTSIHKMSEEGQSERTDKTIRAGKENAAMQIGSAEKIAKDRLASDKDLQAAKIEAEKAIHKWTNDVAREGHRASVDNSQRVALAKVIDTFKEEEIKYNSELNKLTTDPNSAHAATMRKLLDTATAEKERYARALAQMTGVPPKEEPAAKRMNLPRITTEGGAPVTQAVPSNPGEPVLTPGKTFRELYGVPPAQSQTEQELMRKSLNP